MHIVDKEKMILTWGIRTTQTHMEKLDKGKDIGTIQEYPMQFKVYDELPGIFYYHGLYPPAFININYNSNLYSNSEPV